MPNSRISCSTASGSVDSTDTVSRGTLFMVMREYSVWHAPMLNWYLVLETSTMQTLGSACMTSPRNSSKEYSVLSKEGGGSSRLGKTLSAITDLSNGNPA